MQGEAMNVYWQVRPISGVCIRLRETIEKLFPEQVAVRRRQTGLAEKSRKCSGMRILTSHYLLRILGRGVLQKKAFP